MKTAVVYYSYSGNTRKHAEQEARESDADLVAVEDVSRPGKLKTFFAGCPAAMSLKSWPIQPLKADLAEYDVIVLMAPVWAGHLAPQINSVIDLLPPEKDVRIISVSGGSGAKFEKTVQKVEERNCQVSETRDIR